jgi:hypothetical protein
MIRRRDTQRSNTVKNTLKTLTLLGLASLTLAATNSQADNGYGYYGPVPAPNAWNGAAPVANPWLANSAYQQARLVATMKHRQALMDERQDAQMQRILQGMDNGRLTSREAAGLLREQLAIANLERNYLSDGRLGPNELVSLEQRLAEAEKRITFDQNNREQEGPNGRHGEPGRPGDFGRR